MKDINDIKRFHICEGSRGGEYYIEFNEKLNGNFVMFKDYKERVEELLREIELLKNNNIKLTLNYETLSEKDIALWLLLDVKINKGCFSGERHVTLSKEYNNISFVAPVNICYKKNVLTPLEEDDNWQGDGLIWIHCVNGYLRLPDGSKIKK